MLGYVEKCGCRPEKITVEILGAPHHQPRIVKKGVELVAGTEGFLLHAPRFFLWLLLDGVELYGLLHLLYGALEIARGLGELGIAASLCRMCEKSARIVVFIFALHLFQLLLIMLRAIEIHVIAGGKRLPVAGGGGVLLGAASRRQYKHTQQPCHQKGMAGLHFCLSVKRSIHIIINAFHLTIIAMAMP